MALALGLGMERAVAADPEPAVSAQPATYPDCLAPISRRTSVPLALLLAIKQVESGASLAPLVSRNKDGSRDLGVYQINDFWLPHLARYGLNERALLTPCGGALAAAVILRYEYRRAGHWPGALARYHSPTPSLQRRYLAKVLAVWRRLAGEDAATR